MRISQNDFGATNETTTDFLVGWADGFVVGETVGDTVGDWVVLTIGEAAGAVVERPGAEIGAFVTINGFSSALGANVGDNVGPCVWPRRPCFGSGNETLSLPSLP